ncbi:TPA_asm: adenain [Bos-associated insect adintovirus]|uniref:Adenain n=1 Tax=Bos-associated insect adintovirus TaxID=2597806 RepID=A0A5H3CX07_9VIRU|nr:TPA_asm: adenain [Bos-associated insect adintovirus]
MKLLPQRPLTEIDIINFSKGISNFRGVFMRNQLPTAPYKWESGIVNLDDCNGPGTHWVAYRKKGNQVEYFDSFGDLRPPLELQEYFGCNSKISYNYDRYQNYGTYNCGHLCLKFLYK